MIARLTSNATSRTYRLHVPASFGSAKRAPLVVVLHGASGNAARVELRYHWDALADRLGFFVAYPQGIDDRWNASFDPHGADDVGFLTDLMDHLVHAFPIDSRRVFVTGMSNGGAMTYRMGCVLSDRIAAIAPVEAWNPGCRPRGPVSLVAVHGLADHQVSFARAQQSVTGWRDDDGCRINPQVQRAGSVTRSMWMRCARGTFVQFYAIAGSGHEWPGSWPPLPGHDFPSRALDATAVIWAAFNRS